nr:sensor domain-containing diguanylate cyclase [uncultured Cellulosilyticum sp.]
MNLNIDIAKELESLQKDKAYITHIIKYAKENWKTDILNVKALMEATLSFLEEHIKKDKSYEAAYVRAVICMQWYYLTFSKYEEGTQKALVIYEICEHLKDYNQLIRTCNILLILYMKQGLFETALEYGLQGLEAAKKYGQIKSEETLVLNIMQLYIELKEYDKALQVANYLEEIGYTKDERKCLFIESALAEIKLHTNYLDEAMIHCEKAYAYALNQGDSNAVAEILYIRSQIQNSSQKPLEARKDFKKCFEISKANDYKELIIRGLISWGEERVSHGIADEVEERLMEAITLAEEIHAIHLMAQAYGALEALYNLTGNWKEAYRAVKIKEKYLKNESKHNIWLTALEQKSTRRELQNYKRLYQQVQKISKVGQRFTANLEIDELIDMIYEQVNELVPADIVGLGMRKKNGEFFYKAYGKDGEVIDDINEDLYDKVISLGTMTLQMDEDIIINNGNFTDYLIMLEKVVGNERNIIKSAIFTKLKIDDKPIGVIAIGNYEKNAYSKNDLRSLQILASYLAVALRNADLFNEVEYLAMYDALTGIYNRGTVLKLGEEQLKRNQKLGKKTAIIMLDIDYFKKINDIHGHICGDHVLMEVGKILKESVRNIDFLGRYGGEEFIVILSDISVETSKRIAERINKKVNEHKFIAKEKEELAITISCGVYLCNEEEDFDTGIKKADDALYRAKTLGRNRIVVYEENTRQER